MTGTGLAGGLSRTLRAAAPRAWFLEDEVAGLASVAGPGAVCVDVGAEYGLYTWTLAGLVGAGGAVHAVEPQPGPATFVATAARLLGAGHVRVHRLAMGAEAGAGSLSLPSRRGLPVHGRAFLTTGADGLGSNAEFSRHHDVPVAVRTLDEFVDGLGLDRLDFVKADVEGAEASVLAGAARTLADFRPTLMLELEDRHLARFGTTVAAIVGDLRSHGYRARCWRPGDGWRDYRPDDASRNVLFVPADADRPPRKPA